jgi:hypothetical protein
MIHNGDIFLCMLQLRPDKLRRHQRSIELTRITGYLISWYLTRFEFRVYLCSSILHDSYGNETKYRAIGDSCEVRTSSTYKESKSIPVTCLGGP